MNKWHLFLPLFLSTVLSGMLIVGTTGCESDSDDDDASETEETLPPLIISPLSSSFNAPQVTNIAFYASGGSGSYLWSVSDASLGQIVNAGNTVIYTSTTNQGANVITLADSSSNTVTATVNQN